MEIFDKHKRKSNYHGRAVHDDAHPAVEKFRSENIGFFGCSRLLENGIVTFFEEFRHVAGIDYSVDIYFPESFGNRVHHVLARDTFEITHTYLRAGISAYDDRLEYELTRTETPADKHHIAFEIFGKAFARTFDDRGGRRLHDRTGGVTLRAYREILFGALNDDPAGALGEFFRKRLTRRKTFQRLRRDYHAFETFRGRLELAFGSDKRGKHSHVYFALLHHTVAENERHPDRARRKLSYDEIVASVESAFK